MGAFLTEEMEEVGLKDLVEGESVYTVPWAMYAEEDGSLWLHGGYTFEDSPKGTLQMKVSKIDGEYVVNLSQCGDHKYSRTGACYMGTVTPIRVAKLEK